MVGNLLNDVAVATSIYLVNSIIMPSLQAD